MRAPSRLLSALVLAGLVACSDSTTDSTPDGDAAVNACETFVDESAVGGARKIVWDLTVANSPTRCMTIKTGQTIAFEGDFTVHPLGPSGGDEPSPFASVPATGKVTFTAAGTFGFVCGVHPSMTGAIQVID